MNTTSTLKNVSGSALGVSLFGILLSGCFVVPSSAREQEVSAQSADSELELQTVSRSPSGPRGPRGGILGKPAGAPGNRGGEGSPDGDVEDAADGVFSAYSLFVESDTNAHRQADDWRRSDPTAAALMDWIADQPQALWIGDWNSNVRSTVDTALDEAGGQLRVFVVYNIPERDCDYYSSGGATSGAAYTAWIAQVASGLGGRPAVVILEPDALALQECLSASEITERYELMSSAVDVLTAAGAFVYLDAGDSNWIGASQMADRLESAGVHNAAGFALNVSHTEYTDDEVGYAEELRALLGGDVHYVIDTSRNGFGPTDDNEWCNPRDRSVGSIPTLNTGVDGLDALLWIKRVGESDGECNGGPAAGDWWSEYALELAANAES